MNYKKSRYNVIIDILEDGRILIYNTFSGILATMDQKTYSVYKDIEHIDIASIQDQEIRSNVVTAIKANYIVPFDMDELARVLLIRNQARFSNDNLSLTIAPTLRCNMCCPYCYENKRGSNMTSETQKKLIDFVRTHFDQNRNLHSLSICWYGGEPLLEKNIIYNLSKELIIFCNEHNITYDACMVTNGALLDEKTARKLFYECKISFVQVTIDGMPERHNQRRIFADGSGSFDIIMKNIELCRSYLPIQIRVNVDTSNSEDPIRLIQYFQKELKWEKNPQVYIASVTNYFDSCTPDVNICFGSEDFAHLSSSFIKLQHSLDRESVLGKFFPKRRSLSCRGEGINYYVIDPEGYYYNCWVMIGKKESCSGHISRPFVINAEYYKWLSDILPPKCEKCEYLPMCAGGCPYYRIIEKSEPNCVTALYNYKETLRLAYRDHITQKTFIQTNNEV